MEKVEILLREYFESRKSNYGSATSAARRKELLEEILNELPYGTVKSKVAVAMQITCGDTEGQINNILNIVKNNYNGTKEN